MGWTDLFTKNNPIAGGLRAGYHLATGDPKAALSDLANGSTLAVDMVWNEAKGIYEKIEKSLYPDAPPAAADTPAGKAAAANAAGLSEKFNAMPAPTYGTAGSVPVSRPTPPPPAAPGPPLYRPPSTAAPAQPAATGTSTARALLNLERNGFTDPAAGPDPLLRTAPGAPPPDAITTRAERTFQRNGLAPPPPGPDPAAQAAYEKANADYDAIYGGKAQTADSDISTTTVNSRDVNYQPGFQAPQIDKAPEIEKAGMIDPNKLPMTTAQAITAPDAVKAGTVTAQTIGPQTQATVADISQDSLGRSAQQEALDRYRAVADGTAPSAAQALLRQSTDESIGAQLGMAATLQGNTPGLALRSGLSGAANALAKSGSAMAALRAQEQETGRAGFLTAATGIRTGDIDIAKSNQTTALTTAANNLQAQVDILKSNQDAALRAGQSNVANDLQAQIQNATNQLETAKANAVNSLNSDIANLTATLDASKANQATQLGQNIADLNARMQTLTANLQAAVSVGNANEANRVQSLIADANRDLEAQKANQQALLDAAKAKALENQFNANQMNLTDRQKRDIAATAAAGNADRDLRQQQVNNDLYTGMGQLTNNALGIPLGVAQADINRQAEHDRAGGATTASLLSGAFNLGSKFYGAA